MTHGPMDGRTDGRMDGRTDRLTDKASYRAACPQLKRKDTCNPGLQYRRGWVGRGVQFTNHAHLHLHTHFAGAWRPKTSQTPRMSCDGRTDRWIKRGIVAFTQPITVMAAIAVRKKVINIGHFSPCFRLQSLQIFLFVRLNQKQLYVLND